MTYKQVQNEEPALLKTVDPVGNSVAHWAVKGGQVKILRFLWANYPEVLWTVNVNGQQPVHTGCIAGKFLCVALLIDISSALEVPDANGCTPLLLAFAMTMGIYARRLRYYLALSDFYSHSPGSSSQPQVCLVPTMS
ncbi:hypothetical protein X801_00479 [Opisthorchis viverrini]|uniref:Uncharacterized protein n=1 Tax=Opisthorchis viverrini TaxID=6198 RepID=A0A1S8XA66_OPIVI|nr:hypothetical protein X801_00479 [Opisthorchis viverrini]